ELFLAGHEPASTCPGVTVAASNLLEGTTAGPPAASSGEESQIEIGPTRAAGEADDAGAAEMGGSEAGSGGGRAGAAEERQAGERAAASPPAPPMPPSPPGEANAPGEPAPQPPQGRRHWRR